MYYCIMLVPEPGGGGGLGACAPVPHEEALMSVLKKSRIYMYGNGLVEIGVFWEVWGVLGWFGVFRGRRFAKKEISRIICTVMVWWSLGWFGVL